MYTIVQLNSDLLELKAQAESILEKLNNVKNEFKTKTSIKAKPKKMSGEQIAYLKTQIQEHILP